ncbi:hypothetical protein JCM8208_007326 [Rhodotorula glutinis]
MNIKALMQKALGWSFGVVKAAGPVFEVLQALDFAGTLFTLRPLEENKVYIALFIREDVINSMSKRAKSTKAQDEWSRVLVLIDLDDLFRLLLSTLDRLLNGRLKEDFPLLDHLNKADREHFIKKVDDGWDLEEIPVHVLQRKDIKTTVQKKRVAELDKMVLSKVSDKDLAAGDERYRLTFKLFDARIAVLTGKVGDKDVTQAARAAGAKIRRKKTWPKTAQQFQDLMMKAPSYVPDPAKVAHNESTASGSGTKASSTMQRSGAASKKKRSAPKKKGPTAADSSDDERMSEVQKGKKKAVPQVEEESDAEMEDADDEDDASGASEGPGMEEGSEIDELEEDNSEDSEYDSEDESGDESDEELTPASSSSSRRKGK